MVLATDHPLAVAEAMAQAHMVSAGGTCTAHVKAIKRSRLTAYWEMQPRLAPCSCSAQAPCRQQTTLCKHTATHQSKGGHSITQNNDASPIISPIVGRSQKPAGNIVKRCWPPTTSWQLQRQWPRHTWCLQVAHAQTK